MIEVKEAVQRAKNYSNDVLGPLNPSIEEIERDSYKGHDIWKITLGYPITRYQSGLAAALGSEPPRHFKSFLIDLDSGDVLAMKIREAAA